MPLSLTLRSSNGCEQSCRIWYSQCPARQEEFDSDEEEPTRRVVRRPTTRTRHEEANVVLVCLCDGAHEESNEDEAVQSCCASFFLDHDEGCLEIDDLLYSHPSRGEKAKKEMRKTGDSVAGCIVEVAKHLAERSGCTHISLTDESYIYTPHVPCHHSTVRMAAYRLVLAQEPFFARFGFEYRRGDSIAHTMQLFRDATFLHADLQNRMRVPTRDNILYVDEVLRNHLIYPSSPISYDAPLLAKARVGRIRTGWEVVP